MTFGEEVRDSLEPILDKLTDIICTQIEENEKEPPLVKIVEENGCETLYINGIEKCSHKNLYISDILLALEKEDIINYEYEGE